MALIICPECGAEISDKAAACVKCGCPIEKPIQLSDMESEGGTSGNAQPEEKAGKTGEASSLKGCFGEIFTRLFKLSLIVCLGVAGVILFISILGAYGEWLLAHIYVPLIGLALLLGVGLYWIFLATSKCPACRKYSAAEFAGEKIKGERSGYETVSHRDPVYDNNNKKVGEIERSEQVFVKYRDGVRNYKCKFCGHKWSKEFSEEI